jgi:hypothetical protein|tara:strand:+ start:111 stop:299 length:189 start_codon:yes stop_codon:yes gene_type:complete
MITQSRFQKNSEYNKDMDNEPMFKGTVDIGGKVYDGEFYRQIEYGKEVMVLCLKIEKNDAPF